MSSPPPPGSAKAEWAKKELLMIFGQVQEDHENLLSQEAEALRIPDLADVWDNVNRADAEALVSRWEELNPRLSLSRLRSLNPVQVAVGLLKVVSLEPE